MRVLCVKIIHPVTGKEVPSHDDMTIGEEYDVLSIEIDQGGAKFRILTPDGTPALFDAVMFVTTQGAIPTNWAVRVGEGGVIDFGPGPWIEPGFWERYFDGDREAIAQFEAERGK